MGSRSVFAADGDEENAVSVQSVQSIQSMKVAEEVTEWEVSDRCAWHEVLSYLP